MSARISKTLGLQALDSMILERERERELPSSIIHHGWWVYLVVCLGLGLLALLSFSDGHSDSVGGTTIAGTTRWCATPWRWNPFAAWRWMEHPRTNSIGCSYSWSIIWCRPIPTSLHIWYNMDEYGRIKTYKNSIYFTSLGLHQTWRFDVFLTRDSEAVLAKTPMPTLLQGYPLNRAQLERHIRKVRARQKGVPEETRHADCCPGADCVAMACGGCFTWLVV